MILPFSWSSECDACHSECIRGITHLLSEEILQGRAFQNDILVISNVSERSHNRITWREILRGYTPQNDNCLLLLSRRKEVTKKGRPLVIGFSCLPLHSPTGAAELAALRQSSPYFRLLPRFRQPDKGGHFPTPTWHYSVSCITE